MRSRIFRAGVAVLLVACLGAVSSGSAAAAPAASEAAAARSSGVNDWGCRPSSAHPNPVVLLHGLGAPSAGHWAFMAPYLAGKGYCVFYFTYGKVSPFIPLGGFEPIADSAREIARFIDDVRAATRSAEVDIVGHSEGGFLSLYIPKVLHLGGKIGKVVSLAPPAHGTDFASLVQVANLLGIRATVDFVLRTVGCDACSDLITGGPAVQTLNAGPVTEPGVAYTIIASRTDVLVTPTETSFVREPGVRNLYVQDLCPLDPVGHIGMAFDPGLATMISNALDPSSAVPVTCSIGLPF
jgi:triacylglycerol esterase/lipase EstA (alpha/beta hydrolase family)